MSTRTCVILATLFVAACGDDPTGSPPPRASLSVAAGPVEGLVDYGWAGIGDESWRMELDGDSLVVDQLSVSPGSVTIEVHAVDDNESNLRTGTAYGEVEGSGHIQVTLVPARSDLRLSGLTLSPESPVAGDFVTIAVDISNDGSGRSGPTDLAIRVGAESQGERFDVPAMIPGEQLRFARVVELTQPAVYQVLAFVDPSNRVPEAIDTNNAVIGLVSVGEAP